MSCVDCCSKFTRRRVLTNIEQVKSSEMFMHLTLNMFLCAVVVKHAFAEDVILPDDFLKHHVFVNATKQWHKYVKTFMHSHWRKESVSVDTFKRALLNQILYQTFWQTKELIKISGKAVGNVTHNPHSVW